MNYGREQQMVAMMKYFAILAIFISTLGLFGLAAYIVHMRSKEVSIRKVLGANSKQVFSLLSKQFLQMVITAFLIAAPIAYILASQWLNSFAYKITIGPLPFAIGGGVILSTVLVAISYEIINSINLNPAEKLRNE
jgi:putative ABC transport system permease protein